MDVGAAIQYGNVVNRLARSYGIKGRHPGATLLLKVEKGESGGNGKAVSSAGARGWTQFMPGTRADYLKRYGVDAYRSEGDALHATALYLSHDARGLAGYNPGDPTYTNYILKQSPGGPSTGAGPSSAATTRTVTTPAKTTVDKHQAIIDALTTPHKPGTPLAGLVLSKIASGQYTSTTPAKTKTTTSAAQPTGSHDTTDTSGKNLGDFEGKPVAGWIAGVLKRARAAGWTGTVNSGYRSLADQTRIYNSGVRPAAKPGTSNHEMTAFPGGAVDVTNAAQLSQILKKIGVTKLQWAGAKDPVHFSHPHNGSY